MISRFAHHACFTRAVAEKNGRDPAEIDPAPWPAPMEFYHSNHDELFAMLDSH